MIGIDNEVAVNADLICAGMSSGPSQVCVYNLSFSGTNLFSHFSRSCLAEGSAFSWINKLAEVCRTKTVHRPELKPDWETIDSIDGVIRCNPWPATVMWTVSTIFIVFVSIKFVYRSWIYIWACILRVFLTFIKEKCVFLSSDILRLCYCN